MKFNWHTRKKKFLRHFSLTILFEKFRKNIFSLLASLSCIFGSFLYTFNVLGENGILTINGKYDICLWHVNF